MRLPLLKRNKKKMDNFSLDSIFPRSDEPLEEKKVEVENQSTCSYEKLSTDKRAVEHEYQRRSKISLVFWFLGRNWFTLFWRCSVACVVCWVCFFGGLSWMIQKWIDTTQVMAKSNGVSVEQNQSSVPSQTVDALSKNDLKKGAPDLNNPQIQAVLSADLYKPSMFFDGACWLRNGVKISVGYEFKEGVYNERTVVKIDSLERLYILDDGLSVSMF